MTRSRISVRTLGLVIALVAADCAILRAPSVGYERAAWVNVIALPMMNVLVLTFYRQQVFRRRGERRPGLTGFQIAGWAATVAALALFIGVPETFVALVKVFDPVRYLWYKTAFYQAGTSTWQAHLWIWWVGELSVLVSLSTALTAGLLLVASLGRWLGCRFSKGRTANLP